VPKVNTNLSAGPDDHGLRLDRFVSRQAAISLRAARRLIERALILVDERPCPAGYKLRPGQTVTVDAPVVTVDIPSETVSASSGPRARAPSDPSASSPHIVTATPDYIAFFKPSGLHTVSLAGAGGPSLEAELPRLFPQRPVILLNRLDLGTSGLVLGAFDERSASRFRDLENAAQVDKRYLAMATGDMPAAMILKWTLDTTRGTRVKVLSALSPDPLRWTRVTPLARLPGATLLEVRIAKGARHQIRAHLAQAGFPIAGDALYGAGHAQGELKLHHWRLEFPGFSAKEQPAWQDIKAELSLLDTPKKEN